MGKEEKWLSRREMVEDQRASSIGSDMCSTSEPTMFMQVELPVASLEDHEKSVPPSAVFTRSILSEGPGSMLLGPFETKLE